MKTAAFQVGECALLYFPKHPEHLKRVEVLTGYGAHRVTDHGRMVERFGYIVQTESQERTFVFPYHLRAQAHEAAYLCLAIDNRLSA